MSKKLIETIREEINISFGLAFNRKRKGRVLVKQDENTYRCTGGYPEWKMDSEDVFVDKFGNLMLKPKTH